MNSQRAIWAKAVDKLELVRILKTWSKGSILIPRRGRARTQAGALLVLQGKTAEATFQYKAAIHENPSSILARICLGQLLDHQGDTARAITEFLIVSELVPWYSPARYNLAQLLKKQGDIHAAVSHLRILTESLNPEYPTTYYRSLYDLGLTLHESGQISEANAVWTKLVDTSHKILPETMSLYHGHIDHVVWEMKLKAREMLKQHPEQ